MASKSSLRFASEPKCTNNALLRQQVSNCYDKECVPCQNKHIEIRHNFIKEPKDKEIALMFGTTNEQLADIFTKALSTEKFIQFRNKLGITN